MSKLIIAICLLGVFAFGSTQTHPKKPEPCGRYQFDDGPVTKIFDTETGRIYYWFPRDEKAQKNPYVFVLDPITGTGTTVELKFLTR